jgi:hypothetical protein
LYLLKGCLQLIQQQFELLGVQVSSVALGLAAEVRVAQLRQLPAQLLDQPLERRKLRIALRQRALQLGHLGGQRIGLQGARAALGALAWTHAAPME